MAKFRDGPLAGKEADAANYPRYLEGPWAGRYELTKVAIESANLVQITEEYVFNSHFSTALTPEIEWIKA